MGSAHELARAVLQIEKRFTEISIFTVFSQKLALGDMRASVIFAVAFIKPLLIYESN